MAEETVGGDALPLLAYTLRELYQRSRQEGRTSVSGTWQLVVPTGLRSPVIPAKCGTWPSATTAGDSPRPVPTRPFVSGTWPQARRSASRSPATRELLPPWRSVEATTVSPPRAGIIRPGYGIRVSTHGLRTAARSSVAISHRPTGISLPGDGPANEPAQICHQERMLLFGRQPHPTSEAPPQTIELGGSAGVIAGGFILSTVGVVARVAMA